MSLNCTLIPANPDIAGIGIRLSIYAQALLSLASALLSVCFSTARNLFRPDIASNSQTVLITGCAILISAFIQAQLYGLDTYHALIVLNLSWLNNLSALLPYVMIAFWSEADDLAWWRTLFSPFALHLTATGAYGIWLCFRVGSFGTLPECNSLVVWVAAGYSVSSTSTSLRIFFKTISFIAVLPFLNVCVLLALLSLIWLSSSQFPDIYRKSLLLSMWGLPCLLIIAGTEQMVLRNQPYVGDGEGAWSFGQTLTLLLVIVPLWNLVMHVWKAVVKSCWRVLSRRIDELVEELEELEDEIRDLERRGELGTFGCIWRVCCRPRHGRSAEAGIPTNEEGRVLEVKVKEAMERRREAHREVRQLKLKRTQLITVDG